MLSCKKLFKKVASGDLVIFTPDTAIADVVYVLHSQRLYNIHRHKIRDLLASLLQYPNLKVENKHLILKALDYFAEVTIDFSDAMLAVYTESTTEKIIYSYDRDFDKIKGIKRHEPTL